MTLDRCSSQGTAIPFWASALGPLCTGAPGGVDEDLLGGITRGQQDRGDPDARHGAVSHRQQCGCSS